jgi:hypothetical protein
MKINDVQHMKQGPFSAVPIHFGLKIYALVDHGRELWKSAQVYLLKRLLLSMGIQSAQKLSKTEMLPEAFEVGHSRKGKKFVFIQACSESH